MRIALLANPESGAGEATEVGRLLAAQGADVERFELDACEAATRAGAERIVVAGGDGSVARAAEVAGRAGVPLAVVPVGTANDFARALGLPGDRRHAVALAVQGTRTRALDLGRIDDGRPFVNAVSAGLSPLAARKARGFKRLLGPLAYALGALRAGLTGRPVACQVRCDDAELFAGKAWQVTVGITGAFGGGAEIDADPRDGQLDVVVLPAASRLGLAVRAYGMRAGDIEKQHGVVTGQGRVVEVAPDGMTGFNVDGEIIEASSLRLTAEPRVFEVVTG